MEYKKFICEPRPQGMYIEAGYQRFIVSYIAPQTMQFDEATKWCREQGGFLPTLEQAIVICENRTAINEKLRAAGQPEIDGRLWTRRQHAKSESAVYVISMTSGTIDRSSKNYFNTVRMVHATKNEKI